MKSIIVSWVYYPAFGHVVEAIEATLRYYSALPESSVSLIVTKAASCEVLRYCKWIDQIYEIDPEQELEPQLQRIPCQWDHVIYPLRLSNQPEVWYPSQLLQVNRRLQEYLQPRLGSQYDEGELITGCALQCQAFLPVRMEVPNEAMTWARHRISTSPKPVISVLLNSIGSNPVATFPTLRTWKLILSAIRQSYPNASFLLTGVTQQRNTASAKRRKRAVEIFAQSMTQTHNLLDVGVERQLALMSVSDIFIAPHTGFAFLAPAAGTPWLALSGGAWGDCTVADTPFFFAVPPCDRYPCSGRRKIACRICDRLKIPTPCLGKMLRARVADVVQGVKHLLDPDFDLNQSFETYRELAVRQSVDIGALWRIGMHYDKLARCGHTAGESE